ncbi:MAG: hypothetical protein ABI234_01690 [Ktedonobacteraceae bacterium]
MHSSEVARLREQVRLEYEAMMQGLSGFAEGSAMHDFISARMARVGTYHDELVTEIGEDKATKIICDLYNQATG